MNDNQDSLRTQIIDSMMESYVLTWADDLRREDAENLFDFNIMPVLEAAMKAGELLLHRATTPQKPVNEAITEWLGACCEVIAKVHPLEATASKRELLKLLYTLEDGAIKALDDARAIK